MCALELHGVSQPQEEGPSQNRAHPEEAEPWVTRRGTGHPQEPLCLRGRWISPWASHYSVWFNQMSWILSSSTQKNPHGHTFQLLALSAPPISKQSFSHLNKDKKRKRVGPVWLSG